MMRMYTLRALAVLPLLLAACGGEPTDPLTNASIVIHNASGVAITAVEYARCSDDEWGDDRLDSGEVIAPGASRTFIVEPGCWDVSASNGGDWAEWYDNDLDAGQVETFSASSFPVPGLVAAAPSASRTSH